MNAHILLVFQAFKIGTRTVISKNAHFAFFGLGFILFCIEKFKRYLIPLINQKITSGAWDTKAHLINTSILNIFISLAYIAVVLSMIHITLTIFNRGMWKPNESLQQLNASSKTKIFIFLLKGFLLGQLLIIVPGVISTLLKLVTLLHPLAHKLTFDFFFSLSMFFFGFCCWILVDKNASLLTCIKRSVFCALHNPIVLFMFNIISVGIMALLNLFPTLFFISDVIYYPIALAAQGYLYKHLCSPLFENSWFKMPFSRPPIS